MKDSDLLTIKESKTSVFSVQTKNPTISPPKSSRVMFLFPRLINYMYADFKLLKEKSQRFKNLKNLFYTRNGYNLNLKKPNTYNEKIIWKKIYDRNPLLSLTADKLLVRSYVCKILGEKAGRKILVPLYHVAKRPEDIPFDTLPEKYVIKANHGSHMHLVVDNNHFSRDAIIELCRNWLKTNYGLYHYEWAYRNISRRILVEKLLLTQDCQLPLDLKLYCFHGKCQFIRVSYNRFGERDNSAYFDVNWNILLVNNPGYEMMEIPVAKPANLECVITLGEKLSHAFDAVRVDFYLCDKRIYFSELTHYDASGLAPFEPETFDAELGSYWKIERNYWQKNGTN